MLRTCICLKASQQPIECFTVDDFHAVIHGYDLCIFAPYLYIVDKRVYWCVDLERLTR